MAAAGHAVLKYDDGHEEKLPAPTTLAWAREALAEPTLRVYNQDGVVVMDLVPGQYRAQTAGAPAGAGAGAGPATAPAQGCSKCGGWFADMDAHMRAAHPTSPQKSAHLRTDRLRALVISTLKNTDLGVASVVPCLFGGNARIDNRDMMHILPDQWGDIKLQTVLRQARTEGVIPQSAGLAGVNDPRNLVPGKHVCHKRFDNHHITITSGGVVRRGFRWEDGKDDEVKEVLEHKIDLNRLNSARNLYFHIPGWIFQVYDRYHYQKEKKNHGAAPVRQLCAACGKGRLAATSPVCTTCNRKYHGTKSECRNHASVCTGP